MRVTANFIKWTAGTLDQPPLFPVPLLQHGCLQVNLPFFISARAAKEADGLSIAGCKK
jgi:hypothetical protein